MPLLAFSHGTLLVANRFAPINGATSNDIPSQVTAESEIQSVISVRPDVPSWVADNISRSLRKHDSQRFESVEALIAAFNTKR